MQTVSSTPRERLLEKVGRWHVQGKDDELLTTGEIAVLFRVSHRAVRHWADTGLLPYIRTLGGHRRFMSGAVWSELDKAGLTARVIDITDAADDRISQAV